MATGFWTSLGHRLLSRQAETRPGPDPTQDPAGPVADQLAGLRLVGAPQVLDRLVTVRPNTIAIVFAEGEPPRLHFPGEHLVPRLRPGQTRARVLVVNTDPVALDVTIDELRTLDGFVLKATTVRLTVQLAAEEQHHLLRELAAEFETELETRLLRRVQQEVLAGAQTAVRMNRLADVRRLSLTELLAGRWLPGTFAGGSLVRRDLSVVEVAWPVEPDEARAGPHDSGPTESFTLNLDVDLARLWREHAAAELRGISGAQVLSDSTVIAVGATDPGAYETSRLQEAFGRYFGDRHVHLISAPASSYADLVRAWFAHVDAGPGRLASVQAGETALLITVDQARRSTTELDHGLIIGSPADRKALRRLVPHEQIEFVAAGSDD